MESPPPVVRDFIVFCARRRSKEWLPLYDEMCRVAGQRLFQGIGHSELRQMGLSLGLGDLDQTAKLVHNVLASA